ncbi:hypothetical protein [Halorubellus sp. PRR65]|nr:hypothetical protein [Halorubellus sp. PRR65]
MLGTVDLGRFVDLSTATEQEEAPAVASVREQEWQELACDDEEAPVRP